VSANIDPWGGPFCGLLKIIRRRDPGTPQKSLFISAPAPLDTRNPCHRRRLNVAR
jgi:hypothetical protein